MASTRPRNRFRTEEARKQFDQVVDAYREQSILLFTSDGKRYRGTVCTKAFWGGYDGETRGIFAYSLSDGSRRTDEYIFYRAGREIAAMEKKESPLRGLLKRTGWSASELAIRIRRPRPTVQRWLNGTAATPESVLAPLTQIAEFIDATTLGKTSVRR